MSRCRHCGADVGAPADPMFDERREQIVVAGRRRQLTPLQWSFLEVLRARQGRIVTREFLMDCLYGARSDQPDMQILCPRPSCRGFGRGVRWRACSWLIICRLPVVRKIEIAFFGRFLQSCRQDCRQIGGPMNPSDFANSHGYLLDATATEFIRTQVARPLGRRIDWCAAIVPQEERRAGEAVWIDVTRQGKF